MCLSRSEFGGALSFSYCVDSVKIGLGGVEALFLTGFIYRFDFHLVRSYPITNRIRRNTAATLSPDICVSENDYERTNYYECLI